MSVSVTKQKKTLFFKNLSLSEAHQSSVPGSTQDAFAISCPAAAPDGHLVVIIRVFKHASHID